MFPLNGKFVSCDWYRKSITPGCGMIDAHWDLHRIAIPWKLRIGARRRRTTEMGSGWVAWQPDWCTIAKALSDIPGVGALRTFD
jgi:hypothetical protein